MADSGAPSSADGLGHAAALDALRARGAHLADPVRFRLIEALARRAADHDGAVRRALDERVASLLQSLADHLERSEVDASAPAKAPARPGALGELLAHAAQQKSELAVGAPTLGQAMPASLSSPSDVAMLPFFRRTWSKLSADQRLAQSRSSLPDNAGPLNSQHLIHRALTQMRELSPAYFEQFIAHVDALLWLERSQAQAAKEVGLPRLKASKKVPRRG
ncbi:MAG: DUF2894 domain-containing protein [Rubrivivax sp.]|nr:MAG: DUF2894 domain-containing protein [Rubrivivax sp.]